MKFCVIGLGRFGYQVAIGLAENGMGVIAIDSNEAIIASIRDQVTQAICMRVTDEASLRSVGVDEMDTVIVAMGENFAQSILITALLKKRMNIPKVIARAIDDIHKDILKLVGADRTILPEKAIGIRLADNLSSPFMDLTRLTKEFSISQIIAPKKWVGKTIAELNLYENYNIHAVGIRQDEVITSLDPEYVIVEGAKLIFSGKNEDLEKINKL
jgi:trk system potassium uptake protein TrkA